MKNDSTCPICEEGNLIERDYEDTVLYKNVTGHLSGFRYSVCDCCDAEITDSAQAKHNKLAIVNFKRSTDGLLTTFQIKEILCKLKISASEASSVIGGGPVSFSKYINGATNQSQSIDTVLRMVSEDPKSYKVLKKLHDERMSKPADPYQIYIRLDNFTEDEISASSLVTAYEPEKSFFHDIGSMIFGDANEQSASDRIIAKVFGTN
ncbi:type II TA system antitoxin MqsA family protein [Pseudomonas moraviensis]|uniref:type II TA system antitoxin MqsA family protein n=1 Tax=Pseudomonas moraviensis TaxID=321662 RepID=UPI0020922857|nr:type II TA system antitoxin MqsA family protein [Pseudomonas moraviensis]UST60743.1 type II toxin-antitoxin system MqsA family antitoxin [Pseudomonas moraviensis]UST71131.1 type II toxin-antitoxin system MqsA family antitoxin [Pseudomonas moraviensis]